MKLIIYIAFEYLTKRKRQTIISILGIMLGVAFFIAIFSMLQGMHIYFIDKIINVAPHITMKSEYRTPLKQPLEISNPNAIIELSGLVPKDENRGIRNKEQILANIQNMPDVKVAPILDEQAFIKYGGKTISTNLVGIKPEIEAEVSTLPNDMVEGSLNNLLTNSNGIILGIGLAAKLGLEVGKKISVISSAGVILKMKVVGIFNTGITAYDSFKSYVLLKKAQILTKKQNVVNQLLMKLVNVDKAAIIANELEQKYGYKTESWIESNSGVFSLFKLQNGIMYSTVIAILTVAGFGIFNIVSTIINEKHKDIAILKSIGFSELDIKKIFILQGVIIGVIGAILGWILGYIFIEILGTIKFNMGEAGFLRREGFVLFRSYEPYLFSGSLAILIAALSAYHPAKVAAQLNPVDIIRGSI